MREIKFRAKRIDNGRWVYGQYFKTPLTDENSGTTPDAGWFFLCGYTRHCIVQDGVSFVIDVETLGQYTGLKDSKGNEIYEGDIVKITFDTNYTEKPYYIGEVKYGAENGYPAFDLDPWIDCCGMNALSWLKSESDESVNMHEVIGNIFSHPHLLEGEQA